MSELEKILSETAQAAVVAALGGQDQLIKKMLSQVMSERVDANGNEPRYGSGDMTYLEWLSQSLLKDAVRTAFIRIINERQEDIIEQVKKHLSNSPDELAKRLVEGVTNSIETHGEYQIKVSIRQPAYDDD